MKFKIGDTVRVSSTAPAEIEQGVGLIGDITGSPFPVRVDFYSKENKKIGGQWCASGWIEKVD